MKRFAVEIFDVENGFVVVEGNGIVAGSIKIDRRKWVAGDAAQLGELIEFLSREFIKESEEEE